MSDFQLEREEIQKQLEEINKSIWGATGKVRDARKTAQHYGYLMSASDMEALRSEGNLTPVQRAVHNAVMELDGLIENRGRLERHVRERDMVEDGRDE